MFGRKQMVVMAAAACLLLMLAPLTMAHNTSNADRKTSTYNPGVSGVYVTPGTAGAVECLDSGNVTGLAEDVDGSGPATCFSILFASGWGSTGAAFCDLEYVNGDETDEDVVDDTATGGAVPDGTWDDGGFGGACHVSSYTNPPAGYNTFPEKDGTTKPAGVTQNAETVCSGTAYASDEVWGGDVPILAGCHYADFVTTGDDSFASCMVNALVASHPNPLDRVTTAQECIDKLFLEPTTSGASYTCSGFNATASGSVNLVSLGKGGQGVSVPDPAAFGNPCPTFNGEDRGDVVIFVNALVSANPACQDYETEIPAPNPDSNGDSWGEQFGWTCSPRFLAIDADGLGDTIVYLPLAGWIDHVY